VISVLNLRKRNTRNLANIIARIGIKTCGTKC